MGPVGTGTCPALTAAALDEDGLLAGTSLVTSATAYTGLTSAVAAGSVAYTYNYGAILVVGADSGRATAQHTLARSVCRCNARRCHKAV